MKRGYWSKLLMVVPVLLLQGSAWGQVGSTSAVPLPWFVSPFRTLERLEMAERASLTQQPTDLEPLDSTLDVPEALVDAETPPPASTDARIGPDVDGWLGMPLHLDQPIFPIDLPTAMRLAGARDLDIAISRTQVGQALADLERARALLLPSLFYGPSWMRHDGQAQIVEGPVQTISKSSLFMGATAASGSSVPGPVPAGGPAQVSGLTTVLRFSDAIYEPLAARQVVDARRAGVIAATNDALLGLAEAYMDLQFAAGRLTIAREAAANAEALAALTGSYARIGAGLEADYRRSLAERDRRRKDVEEAVGELEIASAELVRRTRLQYGLVVAPVEPPETILRMVKDDVPIDTLITTGLRNRPELSEARAFVEAAIVRLRQARLRPFIPSLALRYSGGGYGGGVNDFFGDFNVRSDFDANLYWELANFGFTDRAIMRRRQAEQREATFEMFKVMDWVAAEVTQAEKLRIAATRQMREAASAVPEAVRSLELNFTNIRRGAGLPEATRPIEVLQPVQALAQARIDYLEAVLAYNRAQFRLFHALGRPPLVAPSVAQSGQIPPAPLAPDPFGSHDRLK